MKKTVFTLCISLFALTLSACNAKPAQTQSPETEAQVPVSNITEPITSRTVLYDTSFSPDSVTVLSSESVSVIPDIAEVVYSVRTKDNEAAGCQQKNAESVSRVITLLKDLGIEETSIMTSDYYMNPVYNYSGSTPRLTGYEAVTTLTVSDLPIDNLENILARSVSTGINTVESITYQASGYDESYREALKKAVAAAHDKADILAKASGAGIGDVIRIEETSGYSQARYTDYARTGMANSYGAAKMAALEDAAAIMPGEISVEAGILVEYQLIH